MLYSREGKEKEMARVSFEVKYVVRRFWEIVTHRDTSQVELLMGLCYLGWLIAVAWPHSQLLEGSAYRPMNQITAGKVWPYILLMALNATIKLVGVVWEVERLRFIGGVLGVMTWLTVAASFAQSGSVITGMFVYGAFTLACAMIALNHVRKD